MASMRRKGWKLKGREGAEKEKKKPCAAPDNNEY